MNKKLIAALCILIVAVIGFYMLPAKHKDENILVVGTNAEFPPFSYIDKGEIVGFDIDIAKEVAKRLNKTIKFKDMPFDAIIPDLMLGNIDFVAAGMSATQERAKKVLFSRPYLLEDPLVVLTTSQNKDALALKKFSEMTIVVNEGYTADLYMSKKEGVNLIRLPAPADAFQCLKSGRAEAFVTAKSTVNSFFEVQDASGFNVTPIDDSNENCALVFSKEHQELLNQVQAILDAMEADGTMNKLKKKWKFL